MKYIFKNNLDTNLILKFENVENQIGSYEKKLMTNQH